MLIYTTISIFTLGLIFGSFYNVIGLRVPQSEDFLTSRSKCPNCGHTLAWFELIPVLSYVMQGGKCRSCHARISMFYPFVELSTGILFAFSYIVFGTSLELIVSLCLMSLFMILFVSDMKYMLIPDRILLFFLPIFILLRVLEPLQPWYSSILGAFIGAGLLALIIIVSRGGMGAGDMKLFGVLGIVLGVKATLLAFFLSTLFGALISGVLLALGVIKRQNPVPFGPYIILGSIVAYFFGDIIIEWYLTTLIR
ncbi:prepilin peptidase [Pontibacillus yanchengensis]|uniref:Prepilin peptidase n=1 Tax=Pontibacillus yanchengensis TaxID=462910 RepID=A0ACC7VD45_9BACI|nr:A24 family peptidase [Pontibacillus yanchengensis]MYL53353.1 prepilin peptidase [Pontibacillus yanchengensis]